MLGSRIPTTLRAFFSRTPTSARPGRDVGSRLLRPLADFAGRRSGVLHRPMLWRAKRTNPTIYTLGLLFMIRVQKDYIAYDHNRSPCVDPHGRNLFHTSSMRVC